MMAPIRTVVILDGTILAVEEVHDGRREYSERVIALSDLIGSRTTGCSVATQEKGIIHPLAARLTLGTFSLADDVHLS